MTEFDVPEPSLVSETIGALLEASALGDQVQKETATEKLLRWAKLPGGAKYVVSVLLKFCRSENRVMKEAVTSFLWRLYTESSELAIHLVAAALDTYRPNSNNVSTWIKEAAVFLMCSDTSPTLAAEYVATALGFCSHLSCYFWEYHHLHDVLDTLIERYKDYGQVVEAVLHSCDDPVDRVRCAAYARLGRLLALGAPEANRMCARVLVECSLGKDVVCTDAFKQLPYVLEACPQLVSKVAAVLVQGCTSSSPRLRLAALQQLSATVKLFPEKVANQFADIVQEARDDSCDSIKAAALVQMPAVAKACPTAAAVLVTMFIEGFPEILSSDFEAAAAVTGLADAVDACPHKAEELAEVLLRPLTSERWYQVVHYTIKNVARFIEACPAWIETLVGKLVYFSKYGDKETKVAVLKQILPSIVFAREKAEELVDIVLFLSRREEAEEATEPRRKALNLLPELANLLPESSELFRRKKKDLESASREGCVRDDYWLPVWGLENIEASIEAFPESADAFISGLLDATKVDVTSPEERVLAMRLIPFAAKACPPKADDLIDRLLGGCNDESELVRVEALRQMHRAAKWHPPYAKAIVKHMLRCCARSELYANITAREQLPNVLKETPDITKDLMACLLRAETEDSRLSAAYNQTVSRSGTKRANIERKEAMVSRKRQHVQVKTANTSASGPSLSTLAGMEESDTEACGEGMSASRPRESGWSHKRRPEEEEVGTSGSSSERKCKKQRATEKGQGDADP